MATAVVAAVEAVAAAVEGIEYSRHEADKHPALY